MLGSAFLVFLGFLHGDIHQAMPTSSTRFSGPLPSDNYMPYFWGNWFYEHAHSGTPPEFTGNWLASDRPPLQMGYLLTQQPFHLYEGELNYEVLGVCLQQLWIVGLWALLAALRVGRVTKALVMVTLLVSDLTIVNGFYVWPKLLPAAMLLGAAALLITPLWGELRGKLWAGALIAALCGLAMMGHGSSVYGIIALGLIAAFRGLPSWRWLGVAVLTLIVVMAPWSAYQKWGDPPGNRLTKWYLGGDTEPDKKSVSEAIIDGYGEAKLSTILHKKGQNFVAISGGKSFATFFRESREAVERGDFELAVRPLRESFFFYMLPSLGLLLLGPVAMAISWRRRRRRPVEWKAAATVLGTFLLGLLVWSLLQWGGWTATTVIHQGSYLLPALGLVGCTLGLRAVWPRFAIGWLALNAIVMLVIYVPNFEPAEGSTFSLGNTILAAVAFACFGLLAFGLRPGREPAAADPQTGAGSSRSPMPSPVSTRA
jgi:MFS family permease